MDKSSFEFFKKRTVKLQHLINKQIYGKKKKDCKIKDIYFGCNTTIFIVENKKHIYE